MSENIHKTVVEMLRMRPEGHLFNWYWKELEGVPGAKGVLHGHPKSGTPLEYGFVAILDDDGDWTPNAIIREEVGAPASEVGFIYRDEDGIVVYLPVLGEPESAPYVSSLEEVVELFCAATLQWSVRRVWSRTLTLDAIPQG